MERILIVGGGIVGSCIAYHLARAGAAAAVTVVEPDPTYAFAATPRADVIRPFGLPGWIAARCRSRTGRSIPMRR